MFADLNERDNSQKINELRTHCTALALILVDKGVFEVNEFVEYLSKATHLVDQLDAKHKEDVVANMDEKERACYDTMNWLFGKPK